jgi:hypothetical protein
MPKSFSVCVVLICYWLVFSCSEPTKNDNSTPETKWKTVFFDDFNRTNTNNGNLGDNWNVSIEYDGLMQIINNEVYTEGYNPRAVYINDIDYTTMRITVKARTDTNIYAGMELFVRTDSNMTEGYFVGKRGGLCFTENRNEGWLTGDHCELHPHTTYILQIVTDSTDFACTIEDSVDFEDWEPIYHYGDLVSGKVGFSAHGVRIDDFRIEIPE